MFGLQRWRWTVVVGVVVAICTVGWFAYRLREPTTNVTPPPLALPASAGSLSSSSSAEIPSGVFLRGRGTGRADNQPARRITLAQFRIDRTEVSNARFARFVSATGYVTTAERQQFGRVFDLKAGRLQRVPGADWRHPEGANSTIVGKERHPVVQVSWTDAIAFASWDGKRLPTEAEYERAARGGLNDRDFPWGSSKNAEGNWLANTWQGDFPYGLNADDRFRRTAPIASFPPNAFGLHDVVGNVREWCADWHADDYYQISPKINPQGPSTGEQRVVRGGSWLSTDSSQLATVWARDRLPPDWCDDRTGFRCVK